MKEYKVGEYYIFQVKGLSNRRIYLEDKNKRTYSVYAYDFQTEWDWSSPQVPEEELKCYVKEITQYDQLILEQSKEILLITLYPEASREEKKVCTFTVKELKTINDTLYYVLIDAYGITHMYRPNANYQNLQPADEIDLYVTRINPKENNRTHLVFEEIENITPSIVVQDEVYDDDTHIGEFGEENDRLEFKSTIIYPAGATGVDIDTQMHIIIRTIAGFMNAKGGTLYIGVNKNGNAVGIEKDYQLLNSSSKDPYTYPENKDGYENKIRTGIKRHLSSIAQDHVKITFPEHNSLTVCKVEVEASDRVIWYDERHAYKRIGNRTSHLTDMLIEKLVLDKMKFTLPDEYKVRPTIVQSIEEILPEPVEETEQETMPTIIKVAHPELIKKKGEERQGHGSFYMNLFYDGCWSWSRNMPQDDDLEFCIPINSPASSNFLMMVYADGCVNKVDAYHLHLSKTEGRRYMNGRRNDGVQLVKVFHAKENDILACFCKQHGHEFVKAHTVSHISTHETMHLNGNRIINTASVNGITDVNISFVSSEHFQRISDLIKTENQTSNSLGFQMDLPKNTKYIDVRDTLKALCDIPAKG